MRILRSNRELIEWRSSLNKNDQLGFVPTMGALHQGHLSLVEKSKSSCSKVLVSIFVNPLQFNDKDDFEKYPTRLDEDLKLLKDVDAVWIPSVNDLYPQGMTMKVTESELSNKLCGQARPGHFDGVLTVVMKLFQLTQPHKAFFGEKDYQQLLLIQKMVREFFLNIEIIAVPTVREESGLAMSSRNLRLSEDEKRIAAEFYKALKESRSAEDAINWLNQKDFKVDYVQDLNGRRFGAVLIGSVRLIDNVQVDTRSAQ